MEKRILLSVCGITPQIITETLYALIVLRNPPFIPEEIHVITTKIGKEIILEKLLHPIHGKFFSFVSEYNIPQPVFNENIIYVVDESEDLLDEKTNKITCDLIFNVVKKLCIPETNYVHASIAGGRKTMSLFMGMAMQFYAKEIDEMSHIIVNSPFENHPEFFYPPKYPKKILVFNSEKKSYEFISTKKANVYLVMVPFMRLRSLRIYEEILKNTDFSYNIKIHKKLSLPFLNVNVIDLSIMINSFHIDFTPMERSIYFYFLMKKKKCNADRCKENCIDCFEFAVDINLGLVSKFYSISCKAKNMRIQKFDKSIKNKQIQEWFLQHRSRINRKIKNIDPIGLCKISSYGKHGSKRYGIFLPKERINFYNINKECLDI